jgi:hypothetical protein
VAGPVPIQNSCPEASIGWRWIGEPERAAITTKAEGGVGVDDDVEDVEEASN